MPTKSPRTNPRPTVSIIGAGRVGQTMAHALQSVGYSVVSLVFHDLAARRGGKVFLKDTFPASLLLGSNELERLPPSDVVLITTPDDAIAKTAQKVAALHQGGRRRAVMHTSGALSSEVLSPLIAAGFSIASIHPLVAVDSADAVGALRGGFYCIEGQRRAVSLAKSIALDLSGTPILIKPEQKALYHLAALMASPHLVALFDLSVELMVISGVELGDARKMLLSLVESTVRNLHERPPRLALTGTFARGDSGTVERHLKALSKKTPAEALEVYKLLGLRSLQLAKANGLDPKKAEQIVKLLNSGSRKPR